MRPIKTKTVAAVSAAAASAAILALASPAFASVGPPQSGTYHLSPGSNPITAGLSSGSFVFQDTTSARKPKLTCTGLTATGAADSNSHKFYSAPNGFDGVTVTPGSTTTPTTAGGADDTAIRIVPGPLSLTGCTNNTLGALTFTPSGTWRLWLQNTTPANNPVISAYGYLGGIQEHVTATAGGCSFDLKGWFPGTYTTATGVLASDPTVSGLKISGVTGASCVLPGIANGDLVNATGSIAFNPIQNVVLP